MMQQQQQQQHRLETALQRLPVVSLTTANQVIFCRLTTDTVDAAVCRRRQVHKP